MALFTLPGASGTHSLTPAPLPGIQAQRPTTPYYYGGGGMVPRPPAIPSANTVGQAAYQPSPARSARETTGYPTTAIGGGPTQDPYGTQTVKSISPPQLTPQQQAEQWLRGMTDPYRTSLNAGLAESWRTQALNPVQQALIQLGVPSGASAEALRARLQGYAAPKDLSGNPVGQSLGEALLNPLEAGQTSPWDLAAANPFSTFAQIQNAQTTANASALANVGARLGSSGAIPQHYSENVQAADQTRYTDINDFLSGVGTALSGYGTTQQQALSSWGSYQQQALQNLNDLIATGQFSFQGNTLTPGSTRPGQVAGATGARPQAGVDYYPGGAPAATAYPATRPQAGVDYYPGGAPSATGSPATQSQQPINRQLQSAAGAPASGQWRSQPQQVVGAQTATSGTRALQSAAAPTGGGRTLQSAAGPAAVASGRPSLQQILAALRSQPLTWGEPGTATGAGAFSMPRLYTDVNSGGQPVYRPKAPVRITPGMSPYQIQAIRDENTGGQRGAYGSAGRYTWGAAPAGMTWGAGRTEYGLSGGSAQPFSRQMLAQAQLRGAVPLGTPIDAVVYTGGNPAHGGSWMVQPTAAASGQFYGGRGIPIYGNAGGQDLMPTVGYAPIPVGGNRLFTVG